MQDDGGQDSDQLATRGEQGGRRARGTRRRVGVGWVRRGAASAKMTHEVHPPRDTVVNDQGRFV
jgi:hypothetical protein